MESNEQSIEIRQLLAALRRRWFLIFAITALAAGAAYGVSKLQETEYQASAKLLFREPGYAQDLFGAGNLSGTGSNNDPARTAETNVKLVGLRVVSDRTARALHRRYTASEVASAIAVAPEGTSDVVSVTATQPRAHQARVLANTFARQFTEFRAHTDRSKLLQAKRLAQHELDGLSPEQQSSERGQSLSRVADRLGVLASLQTGNAELVQRADLPSSPSAPQTRRNTIIGGILGLLLGIALAFLLERLDRRLRSPDDAAEAYQLPVLGTIPESRVIAAGTGLSFEDQEAFRTFRSTLRYFNVDRDVRSVLVTSSAPGEGKSTIAWHLAEAASQHSRVVLVEADLRNPSISEAHGLSPAPGLVELLTNQVTLDGVTTSATVVSPEEGGAERGSFDVIVSGLAPPNPVELIDSRAMKDLLIALQKRYDFVVVDSPPPSVVSDAFPLVTQVSGVIVVCRLGKESRDSAVALREQLKRLRAPLLGVVANRAKRHYAGSGYGYGYSAEAEGSSATALQTS